MFTQPSCLYVFLGSSPAGNADKKQNRRIHATASCVHLLIGAACAAVTLPFDLRAAAFAPVAVGFAKGFFDHYARDDAGPANFVSIIAGAALVVGAAKLAGLA